MNNYFEKDEYDLSRCYPTALKYYENIDLVEAIYSDSDNAAKKDCHISGSDTSSNPFEGAPDYNVRG